MDAGATARLVGGCVTVRPGGVHDMLDDGGVEPELSALSQHVRVVEASEEVLNGHAGRVLRGHVHEGHDVPGKALVAVACLFGVVLRQKPLSLVAGEGAVVDA